MRAPAGPAPESASTCADPSACAPGADPAPPAPPPLPSGWDAASRRPVQFRQSLQPRLPVAPQPHIAGLPRNPEPRTQLRHRLLIPLILKHKAQLLVHRTARFPRHRRSTRPSHVGSVSYLPGSICQLCPRSVPVRLLPPSLQWVPWPPVSGALRFPTFVGTIKVVRLLQHPSVHPPVDPWLHVPPDPFPEAVLLVCEGTGSSLRFLGHPCGACPKLFPLQK